MQSSDELSLKWSVWNMLGLHVLLQPRWQSRVDRLLTCSQAIQGFSLEKGRCFCSNLRLYAWGVIFHGSTPVLGHGLSLDEQSTMGNHTHGVLVYGERLWPQDGAVSAEKEEEARQGPATVYCLKNFASCIRSEINTIKCLQVTWKMSTWQDDCRILHAFLYLKEKQRKGIFRVV